MQKQRKLWQSILATSTALLIVPPIVYGQSRGTGASGADSGFHSGSAATGQYGTSGVTDAPPSSRGTAKAGEESHTQTVTKADVDILRRLQDSIRSDPALASYAQAVIVEVSNGTVTLRGPVKTEKEKADLGDKAQRVEGVKEVNNQLQISPNLGGTTGGREPQEPQTENLLNQGHFSTPLEKQPFFASFFIAPAYAEESLPPTGSRSSDTTSTPQPPPGAGTGSGSMHQEDRTGTTGPSGSQSTTTQSGSVDPTARVAKPAGDYAATDNDRELVSRIRLALTGPQFNLTENNLHIVADNGEIALYGWVKSEQEKKAISDRVRTEAGVQGVNNYLRIVGSGSPVSENR
jgi:hyperosmotically inducible protein